MTIEIAPVTADRWTDLEALFGKSGASAGCWCMWWRTPHKGWKERQGETNRLEMKALVESGIEPGLLAYLDGIPVGWVSVGRREQFPRLETYRSGVFAQVDDAPVWSVVCFFVRARQRRKGVAKALLQGVIGYARQHGAKILEAYPHQPPPEKTTPWNIYTGTPDLFSEAGFVEAARRSEHYAVMRLEL